MKSNLPLPLYVKYKGFVPFSIFMLAEYSVRVLQGFTFTRATISVPSVTVIIPSAFPQISTEILFTPPNSKYLKPAVAPLQKFAIYWSGLSSLSLPLCVKYGWHPLADLKIPP